MYCFATRISSIRLARRDERLPSISSQTKHPGMRLFWRFLRMQRAEQDANPVCTDLRINQPHKFIVAASKISSLRSDYTNREAFP